MKKLSIFALFFLAIFNSSCKELHVRMDITVKGHLENLEGQAWADENLAICFGANYKIDDKPDETVICNPILTTETGDFETTFTTKIDRGEEKSTNYEFLIEKYHVFARGVQGSAEEELPARPAIEKIWHAVPKEGPEPIVHPPVFELRIRLSRIDLMVARICYLNELGAL